MPNLTVSGTTFRRTRTFRASAFATCATSTPLTDSSLNSLTALVESGRASPSTTLNVYDDVFEKRRRVVVMNLENMLGEDEENSEEDKDL